MSPDPSLDPDVRAPSAAQIPLVWVVLLGAGLGAGAAVLLGQDGGFDLKNYHWYNPHALLEGRLGQDFVVAQLQGYFNPLLDLPFYLGVTALGPRGGALVMGALHGLNFALIVLLAQRLLPRGLGGGAEGEAGGTIASRPWVHWLLLALVGCWGPVFVAELGASRGDTTTSLFVLASLLVLLRAGGAASGRAGLLLGLGWGLKLTLGVYVVGTGVALVLAAPGNLGLRLRVATRWALGVTAGLLVSFGPWALHLARSYESPVFPFANHLFRSPWAPELGFAERRFHPDGLVESLTFPLQFASGGEVAWEFVFRDLRFALLYLLLLAVLGLRIVGRQRGTRPRERQAGADPLAFTLTFAVVSYLAWQLGFCVYRYLAPLELLVPTLIVAVVARELRRPVARTAVQLVLLVSVAGFVQVPQVERLPWQVDLFGVELPAVEQPALVVLAGDDATSYLVPSFPGSTRFLRIQSNLSFPDDATRLNAAMQDLIRESTSKRYFLKGPHPIDHEALSAFELQVVGGSCRPIDSRVDSGLALCDLVDTAPGAAKDSAGRR